MASAETTHGAWCVYIGDLTDLDVQLRHTRTKLKDAVRSLDDLAHAVVHAKDPETVQNLIGQLRNRLMAEADSITNTLDSQKEDNA